MTDTDRLTHGARSIHALACVASVARAIVRRMFGDPERGLSAARDAIAAWYELGNLGRLPLAFKLLAVLELQAGEGRAVRLETAARRLSEDIGGDLYQVIGQLGAPLRRRRSGRPGRG